MAVKAYRLNGENMLAKTARTTMKPPQSSPGTTRGMACFQSQSTCAAWRMERRRRSSVIAASKVVVVEVVVVVVEKKKNIYERK
jgi:hypothetical protein